MWNERGTQIINFYHENVKWVPCLIFCDGVPVKARMRVIKVSVIKPPPARAFFSPGRRPFIRSYKVVRVIKLVWADSGGGEGGG